MKAANINVLDKILFMEGRGFLQEFDENVGEEKADGRKKNQWEGECPYGMPISE
jgi:hypothetical protein